MGQETSTLILISLSLLLTLPHLLCNPAPQNCFKHIILYKTAALCSPAAQSVQLPYLTALYLPVPASARCQDTSTLILIPLSLLLTLTHLLCNPCNCRRRQPL